jgi:hypothetical protein
MNMPTVLYLIFMIIVFAVPIRAMFISKRIGES